MKRLLTADFYHFRKSKLIFLALIGAVAAGLFVPAFMKAMILFLKAVETIPDIQEIPGMEGLAQTISMIETTFGPDNVWAMTFPLAEGYGMFACPIIALYSSKQFPSGIIRNKIVVRQKRRDIYFSALIINLIFMILCAVIFTLFSLIFARLLFGCLSYDISDIIRNFCIVTLVYATYGSLITTVVFIYKNTAASIITAIAVPMAANLVMSLLGTVLMSWPAEVTVFFNILPTYQTITLMNGSLPSGFISISVVSDILWIVISSIFGILSFRKADLK